PAKQRELLLRQSRRIQGKLDYLSALPVSKVEPGQGRKLLGQRRDALVKLMHERDPAGADLEGSTWLELLEGRLEAELALAGNAAERKAACRTILALLDRLEKRERPRLEREQKELKDRGVSAAAVVAERASLRSFRLRAEAALALEGPKGRQKAAALNQKRLAILEEARRTPQDSGNEVPALVPLLRKRFQVETDLASTE